MAATARRVFTQLRQVLGIVVATGVFLAAAQPAAADGRFLGADLLTDRPALASDFYAGLFGWTFAPDPDAPEQQTILDGDLEIGAMVIVPDRQTEFSESQWISVLSVADVAEAAQAAETAGADILAGPEATGGSGSFAVLRDPQGALLTITHGDWTEDQSGPWTWFDLFTTDTDGAQMFYRTLAGFGSAAVPGDAQSRRVLGRDGEARAGLIRIAGNNVDPAWVPYLQVDDLDAALATVQALGGTVIARVDDAAIVLDPAGAAIGLEGPRIGEGS